MNPLHYPSLELCKKLTEELFPHNTEHYEWAFYYDYPNGRNFISDWNPVWLPENPYQQYLCPSVMELLDELPSEITTEIPVFLSIDKCNDGHYLVCYSDNGIQKWSQIFKRETLPNALAEMWLWLKENDLLPNK